MIIDAQKNEYGFYFINLVRTNSLVRAINPRILRNGKNKKSKGKSKESCQKERNHKVPNFHMKGPCLLLSHYSTKKNVFIFLKAAIERFEQNGMERSSSFM